MKEKSKTKMTEAEYLATGFNRCPKCGSDCISGEDLQVDGKIAWGVNQCLVCEATWTDEYKLVGMTLD